MTDNKKKVSLIDRVLLCAHDNGDMKSLADEFGKKAVSRAMLTLMNRGHLSINGITATGKEYADRLLRKST